MNTERGIMFKWKNFKDYIEWRNRLHEEEQVHNMTHDEALKWVLSALGIMDNVNPKDQGQKNQINDALSSPLSSYPEKLDSLANQLQIKNASNWPQIQAALGEPEKTTVSKLVAILSANATPKKTISDQPEPEDSENEEGQMYKEPDGRSPL